MAQATNAITALPRLDANGYSGHLSFLLHLRDTPRFLASYRSGDFRPHGIIDFGKPHGISINKMIT